MVTMLAFVVLGGGAYAAGKLAKNSVRSKNIVNGQVLGKDVREASLGVVPRAANGAQRIDFQRKATDPTTQADQPGKHLLLHDHELKVTASCFTDGADKHIALSLTTAKAAYINHFGVVQQGGPPVAASNGRLLNAGETYSSIDNSISSASRNEDQVAVVRFAKRTTTLTFHSEVNASPPAGLPNCLIEGTAVTAPRSG
jgi:hypothetical protein